MRRGARLLGLALGAAALAGPAFAQESVHGADAAFAGRGVVIVWGVVRGADAARAQVVIRVVARDARLGALAVDGVDPFTNARVARLSPIALPRERELRIPRAAFADHPRTELHFARSVEDLAARRPQFTVWFGGVPDTTPELADEAALAAYLDGALARLTGAK